MHQDGRRLKQGFKGEFSWKVQFWSRHRAQGKHDNPLKKHTAGRLGGESELWQHSAEENIPTGGVWKKHTNVCEAGRITDGANMTSGWWMSCHLTAQSAPCELLSLVVLLVNDIKMWLVIGQQTTWLGLRGSKSRTWNPSSTWSILCRLRSPGQDGGTGISSSLFMSGLQTSVFFMRPFCETTQLHPQNAPENPGC